MKALQGSTVWCRFPNYNKCTLIISDQTAYHALFISPMKAQVLSHLPTLARAHMKVNLANIHKTF